MKHLLFIGTTSPSPGHGSAVIFYRHLKRLKGWKISIITNTTENHSLPKDWNIIKIPELITSKYPWWQPKVKSKNHFSLELRLNYLRYIIYYHY